MTDRTYWEGGPVLAWAGPADCEPLGAGPLHLGPPVLHVLAPQSPVSACQRMEQLKGEERMKLVIQPTEERA